MKTYQDLVAVGVDESARMEFVRKAVDAHKAEHAYHVARDAEQYYAKKNVTILKYEKTLMNAMGQAVRDVWSSNYKLTHGYFRQFVLQQTQYVLSNGVTFEKPATKETLGADFDNKLQTLAKKAMVDGVTFGFWNNDHIDVFSYVDTDKEPGFAPLYDADTGLLRAGVRYWQPSEKVYRWTLYEQDGYTDYIMQKSKKMEVLKEKQPYISRISSSEACGVESIEGQNYPGFPIIPMYANDLKESELIGIRPSIDCYDFIMSGMANTIDETSVFYWTIENAGGMDDADLVQFVNRMKQLHAFALGDDQKISDHQINIPVEANKMLLDYLKDDMYETFMLMNPAKALSGNQTATAIRLAYQPQDDKCGAFEYCLRDFIAKLFCIVGIDDEPTFKWNRIANLTEETNMVMAAASELDQETILKHLPWLTPEEVEQIMKRKAAEEAARVESGAFGDEEEPEENEE